MAVAQLVRLNLSGNALEVLQLHLTLVEIYVEMDSLSKLHQAIVTMEIRYLMMGVVPLDQLK